MAWFCQSRCLRNLNVASPDSQTAVCGSPLTGWSREAVGDVGEYKRRMSTNKKAKFIYSVNQYKSSDLLALDH